MAERRFADARNPEFNCSEAVLLLPFGRHSYLPAIVDRLGAEQIRMDETTDREVYAIDHRGGSITLVYPGMGSPAAANALEMVAANGGKRVIVFGACGGTDPSVGVGELIVATAAVRGEGTSRYYAPPAFPAVFDPMITASLIDHGCVADTEGVNVGVVYTTDAGYRQGPEIYEECAGLVVAVESECAAVAVVSARLGLAAGALLFCTDNVTLENTADRGYRGLQDPRVQLGFEVGLEVAVQVLTGS
jgi:uridine phosphorylase